MSIHYEFPIIRHIDDLLPHLDDKSFAIREKDCGNTYINYLRMGSETFPFVEGSQAERLRAVMRREARGIAFNTSTGVLVSRPFHKFFNVGENEQLTLEHIGFHRPHVIMDKMDGSMVRPIPTTDGLRWGTKMGCTDTSNIAEAWLVDKPHYRKFALRIMSLGMTPIFEFVSLENRIVVRYDESNMVLLAIRNNLDGTYMDIQSMRLLAEEAGIPAVNTYPSISGNPSEYFEALKVSEDLDEGVVCRFPNGHMCKAKTDQYNVLHRIKDQASTERNLILGILSQEVDDLIPMLDVHDGDKLRAFIDEFWIWVDSFTGDIQDIYDTARRDYETKRDFAIGASHWPHDARSIVFTLWDGKSVDAKEHAMKMVNSALTSETKWAEFRASLGGSSGLTRVTFNWLGKEGAE